MTYVQPGQLAPGMQAALEVSAGARVLPGLPILPSLGVVAVRNIGRELWTPEQFAQWPGEATPEEVAVMNAGGNVGRELRGMQRENDARVQTTAAYAAGSLLTTAREFFLCDDGEQMQETPRTGGLDPSIAEGAAHLADDEKRDTVLALFARAALTFADDGSLAIHATNYRNELTRIESARASADDSEDARLQDEQKRATELITDLATTILWSDLDYARRCGRVRVGSRDLPFHPSEHQVNVAAHNLTRWRRGPFSTK